MRRGSTSRLAPALALLVGLAACRRLDPVTEAQGAAVLRRNLLRAAEVEVCAERGDLEDACARAASRWSLAADGFEMCVLARGLPGDRSTARMVVGTVDAPGAETLAHRIGADVERGRFRWSSFEFDLPGDALIATFQDPERPGLPVTLVLGNDPARLEHYVEGLAPGWRPHAAAYRAGEVVVEADLTVEGAVRPERRSVPGIGRYARIAALPLVPSSGRVQCRAAADVPPSRIEAYLERATRARERVMTWAAAVEPEAPPWLVLFSHPEDFARVAGRAELSAGSGLNPTVYALLDPALPDDAGAGLARSTALAALGRSVEPWLEDGVAVEAADAWWGRDLEEWVAWLSSGRLVPAIDDLVDARAAERCSAHALVPARAALVRHLRRTKGDVFVRELWSGGASLPRSSELAPGFEAWLDQLAAEHAELHGARRVERQKALLALGADAMLGGVGLAAPQGAPERGYGSRACAESLRAAVRIGARVVALETFLAARDELPGRTGPGSAPLYAPREGDVPLASTLGAARARGLATILKPSLLSSPAGTWSGILSRGTEADWTRFFDDYERFAVHYGLLGELLDADLLSIGGGIQNAVDVVPDAPRAKAEEGTWKRSGWARVVRAARSAYSGGLVYAAAWPGELREVGFWDDLDAVGVDLYAGAEDVAGLGGRELDEWLERFFARALSDAATIARQHAKPVWLTQAGFADGPDPDREGGAGLQVRMLAALDRAIRAAPEEHPELRGFLLWRWSSDPADRGASASDCTLQGKPAEAAAAEIFAGL